MKILITGASGYIGSRVLRSLKESQKNLKIYSWERKFGNLLNQKHFERTIQLLKPDVALLCAWQTTQTLQYEYDSKHSLWPHAVLGQVNICGSMGIHPIVVGSVADSFASNATPYALAKFELKSGLQTLISSQNISYLRLHYVLDEIGEKPRLLQHIRKCIQNGEVFFPNNPKGFVDYIHIDDVVSAITISIKQTLLGEIEICSGVERNAFSVASREYINNDLDYVHKALAKERKSKLSKPHFLLKQNGWESIRTNNFFAYK